MTQAPGFGFPDRLEMAAEALRLQEADADWLLESLAFRLEQLLPERVSIRRGGLIRPRVRGLTVLADGQEFRCAALVGGALGASLAPVRKGIYGRPRRVPVQEWVRLLEQALEREAQRVDTDREGLNRIVP
ncbi:MAG TPA: hypothetical protein VIA06_20835 [Candidatus Dormibacteraeota bacterium]|jgi:hypothetical protein|nr:hypothetical protein [Candidatus Dormibacteraeota bacterium]